MNARKYPNGGTRCEVCGRKDWPLCWRVPDMVWHEVVDKLGGLDGGVMCPSCFHRLAVGVGIELSWIAVPFRFTDPETWAISKMETADLSAAAAAHDERIRAEERERLCNRQRLIAVLAEFRADLEYSVEHGQTDWPVALADGILAALLNPSKPAPTQKESAE